MRCNMCHGTRIVTDSFDGRVACFECSWGEIIDLDRCLAPKQAGHYNNYGRCSRECIGEIGFCWQHTDKYEFWEQTYNYLTGKYRCDSQIDRSEVFVQVFDRVLKEARVVITDAARARHLQAAQQAKIGQAPRATAPAFSVVYFVERDGFIKVGTTRRLDQRLRAIAKGGQMPEGMTVGPVTLMVTMPGDRSNEQWIHSRFHHHRLEGSEWFYPGDDLLAFIDGLKGRVAA